MSESIIKDVNKWFGDFQVLKNINLNVEKKAKFLVSNWTNGFKGNFDLIFSNPPYFSNPFTTALYLISGFGALPSPLTVYVFIPSLREWLMLNIMSDLKSL